jgi:hypothetical protein
MLVRMIVVVDGEQAIAVGMIAEGAEKDLKGMWRKRGRGMEAILIVIAMAWSWGLELFWSALLHWPPWPSLVGLPFLRHHHNGERPRAVGGCHVDDNPLTQQVFGYWPLGCKAEFCNKVPQWCLTHLF